MAVIEELDKFKSAQQRAGPQRAPGHPPPRRAARARATCATASRSPNGGTLRILAPRHAGDDGAGLDAETCRTTASCAWPTACTATASTSSSSARTSTPASRPTRWAAGRGFREGEGQLRRALLRLHGGHGHARRSIDAFFKSRPSKKRGLGAFPNEFLMLKDNAERQAARPRRASSSPGVVTHLSSQYDTRLEHPGPQQGAAHGAGAADGPERADRHAGRPGRARARRCWRWPRRCRPRCATAATTASWSRGRSSRWARTSATCRAPRRRRSRTGCSRSSTT